MSSGDTEEGEEPSEEPVEATEEEVESEEQVVTPEAITRASEIFAKDGKLTEESIEELSKMDTRELIEQYVSFFAQSQDAAAQAEISLTSQAAVKAIAGGEEGYGK